MSKEPRIFDCFMLFNELDMLECRLMELDGVVDKFVIVECGETHKGTPKPSYFNENQKRFQTWMDKIEYVWVPNLVSTDPMERDREQRGAFSDGLKAARPWDIVLQSDLDEIPNRNELENIDKTLWDMAASSNFVAFEQRLFCFAVDWLHPDPWPGTVAARLAHIDLFNAMRDARVSVPRIRGGGHHMSWLGGVHRAWQKLQSFAHNEASIMAQGREILAGHHLSEGRHVDGVKLIPVDVDDTWPLYVRRRLCPENWFRPR